MAEGVWRAGRWYPDGWEWDSPAEGRDHGHRVRLERTPVLRRDGSQSGRFLVFVRIRAEDPDPDRVRAVLAMLAADDVLLQVSRDARGQQVFALAGPSLSADAAVLHGTLDLLPGWPIEPAGPPPVLLDSAEPPPAEPSLPESSEPPAEAPGPVRDAADRFGRPSFRRPRGQ